jgi:branched-chain amino acid transport system ATP-binding protein
MLEIRRLEAGYGSAAVLHGIDLEVAPGEVVALLGRNGMGKTTTIRCIMGLLRPRTGSILLDGRSLLGRPSHWIARQGLGLVPEGRQVFPTLTVREHLLAFAAPCRAGAWGAPAVFELFPRLAERAGSLGRNLSGGEQQMLAIARALVTGPKLLLLDEATEGLAPLLRDEIWRCLAALKAAGVAILLVDKPHPGMLGLADRQMIMEKGRIAWHGRPAELAAQDQLRRALLGI